MARYIAGTQGPFFLSMGIADKLAEISFCSSNDNRVCTLLKILSFTNANARLSLFDQQEFNKFFEALLTDVLSLS